MWVLKQLRPEFISEQKRRGSMKQAVHRQNRINQEVKGEGLEAMWAKNPARIKHFATPSISPVTASSGWLHKSHQTSHPVQMIFSEIKIQM